MTLFTNPAFTSAVLVATVFGFGNMASSYAIPVFVQTVGGYSATAAGLVLIPAGLVLMALFPISGQVSDRVPAHYPIAIGLLFFALGAALMTTMDTNTSFWTVAIFTMIGRFGMGLIMPPLVSSAMRTLEPDQLNRGSGALNFMRQLGGSTAIHQPGALHYLGNVIEAQAATFGFQDGFLFISIVFVCALIPVWILKRAGRGIDV